MKSNRKKAAKTVWGWKDDYALELAGKDLDELSSLAALYEGQMFPSERTQECALMIRTEMASRNAKAGRLFEGVGY